MKEEKFMKIFGYNDNFYVSNYGRVYSVKDENFLTPYRLNNGRLAVDFKWNGRKYMYQVDKLVVNAWFYYSFINVGCPILDIEHKDGDLTNNWVENLKPLFRPTEDIFPKDIDERSERLKESDRMFEMLKERSSRVARQALDIQKRKTKESS